MNPLIMMLVFYYLIKNTISDFLDKQTIINIKNNSNKRCLSYQKKIIHIGQEKRLKECLKTTLCYQPNLRRKIGKRNN